MASARRVAARTAPRTAGLRIEVVMDGQQRRRRRLVIIAAAIVARDAPGDDRRRVVLARALRQLVGEAEQPREVPAA